MPSFENKKALRFVITLGTGKFGSSNNDTITLQGFRASADIDKAGGMMMGTYSFQPYDPPEIMNAEQAGQFLQIDEKMVIELAEAGKLPGKKLGPVWRFSRDALVAWLSTPETPASKK